MQTDPALYINGRWCEGAAPSFRSLDPASGERIWNGRAAGAEDVDHAVTAARDALPGWSQTALADRIALCERFAALLEREREPLAEIISRDNGKPLWEARTEVQAMIGKVPLSVQAYHARTGEHHGEAAGARSVLRHRPHGVCAVFGPFNFPGHLPNGHIVPALIAGNTIVFKPSELTPLVAERVTALWHEAGIPAGVFNLLQGGRDTGVALAGHDRIDGLYFTGSADTGLALHRQYAGRPGVILALEMGGNNPLVVHDVADVEAAAWLTVQSAYLSAGQRCTCARRLILTPGAAESGFVDALLDWLPRIRVGRWDDEPPPFCGPLISETAADRVLGFQRRLLAQGARGLAECARIEPDRPFLRPGLVDVSQMPTQPDVEAFGPLLQLVRVTDFDAAIVEANRTAFGLASGLLSDNADAWSHFLPRARAGIVNWNRPLTGAASSAPFGGVGNSGNHRPGAWYAADYCAWPVASLEADRVLAPDATPTGIDP